MGNKNRASLTSNRRFGFAVAAIPSAPFVLALLVAFHAGVFFVWHARNTDILNVDNAAQYILTLKAMRGLMTQDIHFFFSGYYPPLFHALTALVYFVIGYSEISASFVVFLWFLALVALTYLIAKAIFDEASGLWAALSLACFPYMAFMSRQIFIEIPTAVFFALFILTLVRTGERLTEKPNLWYGVIAGIALLIKWSSAIYLLGPVVWLFFDSARRGRKALSNLALSFSPALVIAGPWYVLNFRGGVVAVLNQSVETGRLEGVHKLSLIGLLAWYPKVLIFNMAGLLFSLFAAFGLIRMGKRSIALLLFILLPILFLAVFPVNKVPRFIAPILFIVAVLCGVGIRSALATLPKKLAIPLGSLLALYSTTLLLHSSFKMGPLYSENRLLNLFFPLNDHPADWEGSNPRPEQRGWKLADMYQTLVSYTPLKDSVDVLVIEPMGQYSVQNYFRIFMLRDALLGKRLPFKFLLSEMATERIGESDYIVLVEFNYDELRDRLDDPMARAAYEKGRAALSGGVLERRFKLLRRELMPTGLPVALWENRGLETTKRVFRDRSYLFPSSEPAMSDTIHANFEGIIELVGADMEQSNSTVKVTYLWRCLAPMDKRYMFFIHFDGPASFGGGRWPLLGYYHTDGWATGQLIRESYESPIPEDAPPGVYEVRVGVFDPEANVALDSVRATGQDDPKRVKIGELTIIEAEGDEKEPDG